MDLAALSSFIQTILAGGIAWGAIRADIKHMISNIEKIEKRIEILEQSDRRAAEDIAGLKICATKLRGNGIIK